VSVALWKA